MSTRERRLWALLATAVLASSALFFFSYPSVDNDLWGHLLFGRETVHDGGPVDTNTFSYTAPDHEWINHEWLAEVVFFGAYRLAGSPGLILLKLAVGGALVWLLLGIAARRTPSLLSRTVAMVWAMAILWPGFNVRPQIFTFLLFGALLWLCHRYEIRGGRVLYWSVPLIALWINLHGGVAVGVGALALFAASIAFGARVRGRVVVPCVLSVAALLANPYGIDLLVFLWRDLQIDRPITEWEPLPVFNLFLWEFKLAVLLVGAYAFRKGNWRRWEFLLAVAAAVFAFRHVRHTPLFGVAAAPLLAEAIDDLGGRVARAGGERLRLYGRPLLAGGALAIVLLQLIWFVGIHKDHRLRLLVPPARYPTAAVAFLAKNEARGNVAVPFDWGEYLIWKLYPDVRVSIDGRYTTCYPMTVIDDSWAWMRGGAGWKRMLDDYPTEIALTKTLHPVTALMRSDPVWANVYEDSTASVFVRTTLQDHPLLDRFRNATLLPPGDVPVRFPG